MKRIIMAGAAVAILAGCSGGETTDADAGADVSAESVAAQAKAQGMMPEPGQYKATITMTGIDTPGMPAEMAGHGSGMTTTTDYCLTKEEVDQGFEEMMKRGQNGECSYESFNLDDGKMDAVMVCKSAEGTARMTMNGTATPTTSDFTATMAMNFQGMGDATMKFDAKHERVGDCPAK
jgi:hypothetical protein